MPASHNGDSLQFPRRWFPVIALMVAIIPLSACPKKQWTYTPPPAPAPSKDFDTHINTNDLDPNGAARNVDWQPQLQGHVPNPDQCNDGQPYSSACTQDKPFSDPPDARHQAFCFIGKAISGSPIQPFFGHADWMVAQYDGSIGWFNFGDDSDYDLFLVPGSDHLPPAPGNQHGITSNNNHVADDSKNPQYIEMEFDSYETDPAFTSGWWSQFKSSGHEDDVETLTDLLHPPSPDGKRTLGCGSAVGLFGLDCDHGCRSELHPIYGLAIQRKEDQSDNQWSIMARNWGTGGYCSQYNDQLAAGSINVLLPYTSAQPPTKATIQDFAPAANDNSTVIGCPTIYFNNGQTFVNVALPAPDQQAVAAFTLTLQWPDGAKPVACTQTALEPKAMALARAHPETPPPTKKEEYMGALLHAAAKTQNPNLTHLDLQHDILPAAPQGKSGAQSVKAMALARPARPCESTQPTPIEIKTGLPPAPAPLPKTAIHNLAKDQRKQDRDDKIRSYICHNLNGKNQQVVSDAEFKKACKGVK